MKIIFLDRDGVINNYPGFGDYIKNWQEFKFLPGAIEAIKKLTDSSFDIFVISNQAGVSKGIYSQENLDDITNNMLKEIEKKGAKIKGVFYCIHKEEDGCICRKPKIGLFKKALESINAEPSEINPNATYFIGDSILDVETGKNANLKTILVLSGKERIENKDNWQFQPDFITDNLLFAVEVVLKR